MYIYLDGRRIEAFPAFTSRSLFESLRILRVGRLLIQRKLSLMSFAPKNIFRDASCAVIVV